MSEELGQDGKAADDDTRGDLGQGPESHDDDVVADIWLFYNFPSVVCPQDRRHTCTVYFDVSAVFSVTEEKSWLNISMVILMMEQKWS